MYVTPNALTAALMARTLRAEGAAFTYTQLLGTYRTQSVKTDAGWRQTACTPLATIHAAAAAVRQFAEQFPELTVTYPSTLLAEQQPVGNDALRFAEYAVNAVIQVPQSFASQHGGTAFRQMLQEEWLPQVTELAARIAKRLQTHELRTARMFGSIPQNGPLTVQLRRDTAETAVWTIPLEKCGLYPLQWDSEVCGMALLLAELLREPLLPLCGEGLRITVQRDEQAQQCRLIFSNFQIRE